MARLFLGDCLSVMRKLKANSVDAIVTDPPYGLEFMGLAWDKLGVEDSWRSSSGFSKPGIGERKIGWPDHGSGDSANATCARCGGRMRGAKRCECNVPDWRVKGKPLDPQDARRARALSMQEWHRRWATEALRVAKPGAHLLAFGGTRLYHRLTCAIEDAGWIIRDCVFWVYGSGFPKSLDIGKAIDKAERGYPQGGTDPTSSNHGKYRTQATEGKRSQADTGQQYGSGSQWTTAGKWKNDSGELSPEAVKLEGWGTALKPSVEPIVLAMKPIEGTFAANVLKWGTGGLNIDGCRVETGAGGRPKREIHPMRHGVKYHGAALTGRLDGRSLQSSKAVGVTVKGRWPANLITDGSEEVVGLFPSSDAGGRRTRHKPSPSSHFGSGSNQSVVDGVEGHGDSGSAARFFYCAKSSKRDRNEGLPKEHGNSHPTVKPTNLMRYLCRLVTPPDGIILDPFMGSGSTGKAAVLEGFEFVGIEIDRETYWIAQRRISAARKKFQAPNGGTGREEPDA